MKEFGEEKSYSLIIEIWGKFMNENKFQIN